MGRAGGPEGGCGPGRGQGESAELFWSDSFMLDGDLQNGEAAAQNVTLGITSRGQFPNASWVRGGLSQSQSKAGQIERLHLSLSISICMFLSGCSWGVFFTTVLIKIYWTWTILLILLVLPY